MADIKQTSVIKLQHDDPVINRIQDNTQRAFNQLQSQVAKLAPGVGTNFGVALYQGSFDNGSGSNYFSNTGTSPSDFTVNGSPVLTEYFNEGFGTIGGASSNAPGITFLAPATGVVSISARTGDGITSTNSGTIYLTDSNNVVLSAESFHQNTANAPNNVGIWGLYRVTAGTFYTFKLRSQVASGTVYIGGDTAIAGYLLTFTVTYVA